MDFEDIVLTLLLVAIVIFAFAAGCSINDKQNMADYGCAALGYSEYHLEYEGSLFSDVTVYCIDVPSLELPTIVLPQLP